MNITVDVQQKCSSDTSRRTTRGGGQIRRFGRPPDPLRFSIRSLLQSERFRPPGAPGTDLGHFWGPSGDVLGRDGSQGPKDHPEATRPRSFVQFCLTRPLDTFCLSSHPASSEHLRSKNPIRPLDTRRVESL